MSKVRAFLIHLSISATVVGAVFAVIFFAWYPEPYFQIAGTRKVVMVLLGVDLVLGPLLTLILFKSGKPSLVFDLSVIALIQLSALVYGTSIIFQERPYFVVFTVDRFMVVAKSDVDLSRLVYEELKNKPWRGPIFAVANLPDSDEERQKLFTEVLDGKPDIDRRPEYWSPYADSVGEVMDRATALTDLKAKGEVIASEVEKVIQRHPNGDQLVYLPIVSTAITRAFPLVLDSSGIYPVDFIGVDLWAEQEG